MGMITSIRAPLPVAETSAASAHVPRPQGRTEPGITGPVAPPILAQTLGQVSPKPAASDAMLLEARMATAKSSATAAAEAAREAYIKASIAAGISPLPLS